jgi:hypothetical protein
VTRRRDVEHRPSAGDSARVLRECAVDLIRAGDLAESNAFPAVDSASRRIRHVIAELELVAASVRYRAQWLERLESAQTKKRLVA